MSDLITKNPKCRSELLFERDLPNDSRTGLVIQAGDYQVPVAGRSLAHKEIKFFSLEKNVMPVGAKRLQARGVVEFTPDNRVLWRKTFLPVATVGEIKQMEAGCGGRLEEAIKRLDEVTATGVLDDFFRGSDANPAAILPHWISAYPGHLNDQKDDVKVFGNAEKRLPDETPHVELTVRNAGMERGQERLLLHPSGYLFYTRDHYTTCYVLIRNTPDWTHVNALPVTAPGTTKKDKTFSSNFLAQQLLKRKKGKENSLQSFLQNLSQSVNSKLETHPANVKDDHAVRQMLGPNAGKSISILVLKNTHFLLAMNGNEVAGVFVKGLLGTGISRLTLNKQQASSLAFINAVARRAA